MHRTLTILLAIALFQCGCAHEPVAGVAVAPGAVQQEPEKEKQEKGIVEKVTGLVQDAKSKAPSLDDMKKMLSDAGGATGDAANDTMKMVNELYKKAYEQGDTQVKNVADWVKQDWNGMNAWEYKVLNVNTDNLGTPEEKLNELGMQRWDCFHVSESAGSTKFFLKRHRKSYLKNIPLKDLLILVPFMDNQ